MRKSKFSETQIVAMLKDAESGVPVADLTRKHGTFFKWRSTAPAALRDGTSDGGFTEATSYKRCASGALGPGLSCAIPTPQLSHISSSTFPRVEKHSYVE